MQGRDHREPPDKLGYHPELYQILRLGVHEDFPYVFLILALDVGAKTHGLGSEPLFDDIVEANESASADEEDLGCVDLDEILLGMLAAAFGRHVRHRPLENLEQCLLNSFTGDVPRY